MECLGHSIIEGLVALLPGPWVFRLGEMLGGLAWHFTPVRRKIVLRNLRIAMAGECGFSEIQEMAKASFRRTAGNLISAARTAQVAPEKLGEIIHIENLELLEQALAKGKGVVLLLAHMGNWEILSRIVHLFPPGSKTGAFYRPLNNKLLDERILLRRQADGTRMFSKRDPFHRVTGFLRDGGIVGVLADQRVGLQGEVVPFFGRLARTSPLPSLLARRARAEVLALSLVTESPGKWKAAFVPVEEPHHTKHCMAALESAMNASVIDVFWLQERWKVYVRKKRPVSQWLGSSGVSGVKPLRMVLWLAGGASTWRPPAEWLHPELRCEAVLGAGDQLPDWLPADTPVHRIGASQDLGKTLVRIDQSAVLPIDLVLSSVDCRALTAAGHRELIPVISLP